MNGGFNQQGSPFESSTHARMVADAPAEARLNFIRKTYLLFMASILAAILAGTLCLQVPALQNLAGTILSNPIIALVVIVGASFAAQAVSRIEGLNYAALFGFTALIGLIFAPVLRMYETTAPGIVTQAAFLTTLVFGSLTLYAFLSRKDFSYLGGLLFVGIIALVVGGLANAFFFKSSSGSYWMAWVTVFLFSGFVLYDTSQIIHRYDEKGYCSAALALFLDFFNLFMAILRILGGNRDR
jgi:FtsH-binding integral membrane protein